MAPRCWWTAVAVFAQESSRRESSRTRVQMAHTRAAILGVGHQLYRSPKPLDTRADDSRLLGYKRLGLLIGGPDVPFRLYALLPGCRLGYRPLGDPLQYDGLHRLVVVIEFAYGIRDWRAFVGGRTVPARHR
jgi:hypothetical protein